MTPLIHVSLVLSVALLYPQQQAEFTGNWYFDRFGGPHGEVVKNADIDKANQQEAGFKFVFTKDGKFKSIEPNGMHTTKDYEYLAGPRRIIIDGDTMKIAMLTSEAMELCPTNAKQPALFLRRNKEERTAMSTP